MNDKQAKEQNIIKSIMEIAPKHCENCGNKYESTDFKVMRSTSINTLLHLKCPKCGTTYMLNVVSPIQGMVGASRMPLNLDLYTSDEMSRFAGKSSTTKDEAISIFEQTDKLKFPEFLSKLLRN